MIEYIFENWLYLILLLLVGGLASLFDIRKKVKKWKREHPDEYLQIKRKELEKLHKKPS